MGISFSNSTLQRVRFQSETSPGSRPGWTLTKVVFSVENLQILLYPSNMNIHWRAAIAQKITLQPVSRITAEAFSLYTGIGNSSLRPKLLLIRSMLKNLSIKNKKKLSFKDYSLVLRCQVPHAVMSRLPSDSNMVWEVYVLR